MIAQLLFILYILSVIGGVIVLLGEERSVVSSIPWILLVIFVPLLGILLYVIFGYSLRRRKMIDRSVRELYSDALVVTGQSSRQVIKGCKDQEMISLAGLIEKLTQTSLTTATEILPYEDSREWLSACYEAIGQAQKYVYIELYRIEEGAWLDRLLELLEIQIKRQVKVYWLYDDVGSRGLSRHYRKRMEQIGEDVATFLPVRFRLFTSRVNYRNHRNLIVVDSRVGFSGGNILLSKMESGDQHVPATTHLRVVGNVVQQLESCFALDWYVATRQMLPVHPQDAITVGYPQVPIWVQIFATHPTDDFPSLEMILMHSFLQARHSLYIESPVLIPTYTIQQAIISTALSGVQVKVILPQRCRSRLAPKASRAFFSELLRAGVEIFYCDGLREATYAVIDKKRVVTGTPYLDFRSFEYNFDLTTIVYSEQIAQQFVDSFERILSICHRIAPRPNSLWRRIVYGVMRLLTPLI